MDTLNVGTIETLSVELTDRIGSITDLSIYAVDFQVLKEDETSQLAWTAVAAVVGMRADCLLDTTGWAEGTYKLYIRPTIGPERPIIGPFEFGLS